jgi:hypothetical protein
MAGWSLWPRRRPPMSPHDPYLTVARVRFLAIQLSIRFRMPVLVSIVSIFLGSPYDCLDRIGSEPYMMFPKSIAELSDQ